MNTKFPRGSEWRKWDLHVHTPASDGTGTPDEIVSKAIAEHLAVIAITDHHSVAFIDEVKNAAKGKPLTVLSGVEFRSEYGSKSVHFIAYFPERYKTTELNAQAIHDLILSQLGVSRTAVIAKGRENDASLSDDDAFRKGMFLIQVDFKQAAKLVHQYGGLISVHNGNKSNGLDAEVKHMGSSPRNVHSLYESLGTLKEELLRNYIDICDVGKEEDGKFYLNTFSKPSIVASDAHNVKDIGSKFSWVKADPTFEGLRQIVFEPEERVRIQEKSPELDIDKSPFTAVTITSLTQVFADNQDVKFASGTLPLNNGLVSIIGGRGTGKSALIGYLAAGFGVGVQGDLFTEKAASFIVARKTSLSEGEKQFSFDASPQVPFVYISQSEVKDVLRNPNGFTQNIRKTIGVEDDYVIPQSVVTQVENTVNEFYRIVKFFTADGTSVEDKKTKLHDEIVRNTNFIENVTSEANKQALEKYATFVRQQHDIESFAQEVNDFVTELEESVKHLNERIDKLNVKGVNSSIKLSPIPHVEANVIVSYVKNEWDKPIKEKTEQLNSEIQGVKERFPEYTGDLATLLQNISQYQARLMDCEKQLKMIEQEEQRLAEVKNKDFVLVGKSIKNSILEYKEQIEKKWNEFRAGSPELTEERRAIIADIFNDGGISVRVDIAFDEMKMYELLMEKLDGRRYSRQRLKERLQISSADDFMNFMTQASTINLFSEDVDDEVRGRILSVFFRRFTEFIHHRIIIESSGRPITKLSHGQQGTIYLKLKIAANMFSETLVYDQPEDDLDNQFITEELVKLFRRIKKHRQVIIVSHNANLVVNADSEQVIVAHNDDGVLSYTSGALEDPEINRAVCQILEGGKQAFENRERKYNLSDGD